MADPVKHLRFDGRLVMIGFGSIGQGVLPLIVRHLEIDPARITILSPDVGPRAVAAEYGARFEEVAITRENLEQVLDGRLGEGDFLLNLSVDVSSVALIRYASKAGACYLDTCIEPWPGSYTDSHLTPSQRSNYALRESALALRRELGPDSPTAVIAHGANPGLVTHFVKVALLRLAADLGRAAAAPAEREGWARLAADLGVKVIHVAERDTQRGSTPKDVGEFVNTWSIDGFYSEGMQPAELGWGSHERHFPADGGRHDFGCGAAIYLNRRGAATRVRTWTPLAGPIIGWLITHNEAISIADYLTLREGEAVAYRPTVHYAYHPCDGAVLSLHEMAGQGFELQDRKRLIVEEVTDGRDELGVLLAGHAKNAFWYGSQLTIEETRDLVPHNNATSLQVTVAVLSGLIWALENPRRGVLEPEDLDHARIMELAEPYLGTMHGAYGDWTPLWRRGDLFPEDLDEADPWQFKNVRVV